MKEFQKAQRLAAERETSYSPFVPQSALPASYTAGEMDASSDKSAEQRALLVERRQEVVLLDNEIAFNEAIIDEREQGIQEIQQQIGEVNEIFKDLAVLVHEQGTMIGCHFTGKIPSRESCKEPEIKFFSGMLAPGDIRNCASDSDHSTGSLIRKSSKMIKGKLKRSSQQQECGLLSNVFDVSLQDMMADSIEAEAPDLVCQLDSVQGMVDALSAVRWKRHQDAVVELSEHGVVLIVEDTGCLQAKVYLQRELFVRYEYHAEGRPRFGVSLGLFVDCLNSFSAPGRSSMIEIQYPGPDMQLLI
ncbi:hypothetical protein Goari_012126, partial [Gossypium aridum]|nr:hypothetical protein [Gossypium aridum]